MPSNEFMGRLSPKPCLWQSPAQRLGALALSTMGRMRLSLILTIVAMAMSACSPEQNWRQVRFEDTPLRVQLPCKPDRTTREVPLGGAPVQLSVVGCESGGAMLAVMTAPLPSGADAQALLAGWQQATLAHLQTPAPVRSEPWSRPGMLRLPAAQRIEAQGRRADGQAVMAQAVWGAFTEGDHLRLVHAVVYADRVLPDLAQTLFDGVQP